ncbi:hypothetical protein HII36_24995 [Nonomuraea sp. NN258]|uniref:hypothetical protein n=1 Tax=Nonomuraea antri TaxID=2730852 RepID=UPI0015680A8F|nr:hypothetical protein [Nonomuraea antri]NRQ35055.1 hypothetical protein [Nonomuraea antri]
MTHIGTRAGTSAATADPLTAGTLALVLAYGGLRLYWQLGHQPERLSPIGPDLVVFTGWGGVGLCAAAALVLGALLSGRWGAASRRVLRGAAWAVGAALIVAGAMLLLDVVGAIVPGLGIPFLPLGAASKAVCAGSGALLWRAALTHRRRTEAGCATCGRPRSGRPSLERTPGWAYAAAYAAMAGCLVRIGAQVAVGWGATPYAGGQVLFEAGFVLAGTVLPLALAHRWGRVWPRWVPGLAGRRVPRRLVLWPAVAVSGGLVAYFGTMLAQMIFERLNGRNPFPPEGGLDLPEWFFWCAVPGYLTWGVGLAVAALAYARRTRTACADCGR